MQREWTYLTFTWQLTIEPQIEYGCLGNLKYLSCQALRLCAFGWIPVFQTDQRWKRNTGSCVFHMWRPAKEATVHLNTTLVAPRGVSVEAAVASVISEEHFFTERQEKNNSTAGFTRSKLCFFSWLTLQEFRWPTGSASSALSLDRLKLSRDRQR